MARINFETDVFDDPLYQPLLLKVGDVYRTKGMLIAAWEYAQRFWLEHKGIPEGKWPEDLNVLIEFKFARVEVRETGRFIYVAGSKEHCAFLDQRSEAGKKGGKSRSPSKVKNLKQGSNSPKRARNETEAKPKRDEAEPSGSQREQSSYSYSYSSSISNSEFTFPSEKANELAPVAEGVGISVEEVKNPVAIWCSEYSRAYGTKYLALGKDGAVLKSLAKGRSFEALQTLFSCYLAMRDPLYIQQKHPLSLFFQHLPKVVAAAQTGIDSSSPTSELDRMFAAKKLPQLEAR